MFAGTLKILLAEDNIVTQRIIEHKLQRENCRITSIASGEKVVDAIRESKPDLVILDLLLPVKNGLTILNELKSDAALADIPVLIFTTNNNEEMLNNALKAGALDYVLKPFSPDELMAKIRKYSKFSSQA